MRSSTYGFVLSLLVSKCKFSAIVQDTEVRGYQAEMKLIPFKTMQVKGNVQVAKNTNQSFQKKSILIPEWISRHPTR